jgi:hypothetical protein
MALWITRGLTNLIRVPLITRGRVVHVGIGDRARAHPIEEGLLHRILIEALRLTPHHDSPAIVCEGLTLKVRQ